MLTCPIPNTGTLCQDLSVLLDNDIQYLINRSGMIWGDYSDNLVNKFNQYEETNDLPIFKDLLSNNFNLGSMVLYYVKPKISKTFFNISLVTEELVNTSIILPLHVSEPSLPYYMHYKNEYLTPFTSLNDIPGVVGTLRSLGKDLIESQHTFEKDVPILVSNTGPWSGVSNFHSKNHIVLLHISILGNPTFDEIQKLLVR